MRVGIITSSIERGPTSVGVVTKNVVRNLLDIADKGVEFILIHGQESLDPIYREAEELLLPYPFKEVSHSFFPLRVSSFMRRQFRDSSYNRRLRAKILGAGLDILHIPHLGRRAPPLAFFSLNEKVKLAATNHGMAQLALPASQCYARKPSVIRLMDYEELLKWKIIFRNKFDLMITVSESEKRNISHNLSIPENRIRVVHHGVSEHFKPLDVEAARKELHTKYGVLSPFIFHASAYQPKKNLARIVGAFHKLENKDYRLVVAGNQPEMLKQLAHSLGLADRVIFLGFIAHHDLPRFYSAATLFVFPSLHESFGLPILEAMACGAPLITSNVFSMPEIAGDAAMIVNPYNVDEIANAMREALANDRLREEMRKKGIERAKQFSWRKCAEEHLKVYEEIINVGPILG